VASLAFGSKVELGYDTTFERVIINDAPQYKCTIQGVEYVTVECLRNVGSLRLISRATRIWKVRRVDDTGPNPRYYVLKDVWLDVDEKSEREKQEDIFSNFNKVNPVDMTLEEARQYFMDIESDQLVDLGDGVKDVTWKLPHHDIMALESSLDIGNRLWYSNVRLTTPIIGAIGFLPEPIITHAEKTYCPKKHHRILFKDVGEPLHHVLDHHKIFGALADVMQGIY
jgi:hypothetical protein